MIKHRIKGFTLIEIAVVLLVVTVILGYTMAMMPMQQELKRYQQAEKEMDRIIESLYAFAQTNNHLPCPAWDDGTNTSYGFECRNNDGTPANCDGSDASLDECDVWFGFVPGKTLGLDGKYSLSTGLLLDPWGQPYRYQVTDTDNEDNNNDGDGNDVTDGDGLADFVIQGGIKATAESDATTSSLDLFILRPDLSICNSDPTDSSPGTDAVCINAASTVVGGYTSQTCTNLDAKCPPVVILSTGKNKTNSYIELENLDNDTNDRVFVSRSFSDDYDDIVKWIAPNVLYSKMIEAGHLP